MQTNLPGPIRGKRRIQLNVGQGNLLSEQSSDFTDGYVGPLNTSGAYHLYFNEQWMGAVDSLTDDIAAFYPGAVAYRISEGITYRSNGTTFIAVSYLPGVTEHYALTAIVSGGTHSISAAPVNALTAAGFISCEVRLDNDVAGVSNALAAGDTVYVGYSETSGDWSNIASDVDDAITAHAVALASRTGANSLFANVKPLHGIDEILPLVASPGNLINEIVVMSNDVTNAYGVTVYGILPG